MNYTENYHLPQWDEDDRIMRVDFNQMCANIEEGMSANAQAAEAAMDLPYVVGNYHGNGEGGQEIYLGFRPSFVIVCTNQKVAQSYYGGISSLIAGPNVTSELLYMTDTGFRVVGNDSSGTYPQINHSALSYDYIAFR